MVSAVQEHRTRRKLIEGRMMRCPRCKEQYDILQYVPLRLIEEFMADTTPIYKCPTCRWMFAPVDQLVVQALSARNGKEES